MLYSDAATKCKKRYLNITTITSGVKTWMLKHAIIVITTNQLVVETKVR